MTKPMEQQILAIAKQLKKLGKKPTVALVRGKLSNPVPMPLLLRTLKQFEMMTPEQIDALDDGLTANSQQATTTETSQLTELKQQFDAMSKELAQVKKELSNIKKMFESK